MLKPLLGIVSIGHSLAMVKATTAKYVSNVWIAFWGTPGAI